MQPTSAIDSSAPETGKNRVSFVQVLGYELRVRDAMSSPPVTGMPTDTLRHIQGLMRTHRISGVPIAVDGEVKGIITIEDIINALDKGYIDEPAEKWMSRNVATLRDHYSLMRAVTEFDHHGYGRFPVLNSQGKLVGIITQGDITICLMRQIEQRAEEVIAHEAKWIADRKTDVKEKRAVVRARIRPADFENAGKLSTRIRQVMRERGVPPDIRRRAAVVAYEAETNIIIHSLGGILTASINPEKIVIEAVDEGPGIENIDNAMKEGWSTAGPLARQLGFGAGMGLPNMKKCSDEFQVNSGLGSGTQLHSVIYLRAPIKKDQEANHETPTTREDSVIVADDAG